MVCAQVAGSNGDSLRIAKTLDIWPLPPNCISDPREVINALAAFSLSIKPDPKPKSLMELIEALPDFELKQLQRYASMILKTASPFSRSYYQQAKRMCPAIGETKRLLLAAVLQGIEPWGNTDGPLEEKAKANADISKAA